MASAYCITSDSIYSSCFYAGLHLQKEGKHEHKKIVFNGRWCVEIRVAVSCPAASRSNAPHSNSEDIGRDPMTMYPLAGYMLLH